MTPSAQQHRLPAAERRRALIEAATRVFAGGSYEGATTAEIARVAGVSEPILYRHFASKRDLFLACLETTWESFRATVEDAIRDEDDPAEWPLVIGRAARVLRTQKGQPTRLWIQAISEAAEDAEIRRFVRRHLAEVHGFFRSVVERAQAAGAVPRGLDPNAEAWIAVAIGLLRSASDRLGGGVSDDDFDAIAATRRRWLTGEKAV